MLAASLGGYVTVPALIIIDTVSTPPCVYAIVFAYITIGAGIGLVACGIDAVARIRPDQTDMFTSSYSLLFAT